MPNMRKISRMLASTALSLLLLASLCQAQWNQKVTTQGTGANAQYFWSFDGTAANQQQVVTFTQAVVTLEYNCEYLPAICNNVAGFNGGNLIANRFFTYDLNSKRKTARQRRSCSNFKTNLPKGKKARCPETGQPKFYRQDGLKWPTTRLDRSPTSQVALRIAAKGFGKNKVDSGLVYTCDEFPPATFVEGGVGDGSTGSTKSNTYCAPHGCSSKARSEQDWQGSSHGKLRGMFSRVATATNTPLNRRNGAVRFLFRTTSSKTKPVVGVYAKGLAGPRFTNNQGLRKRDDIAQMTQGSVQEREAAILRAVERDPNFFDDALKVQIWHDDPIEDEDDEDAIFPLDLWEAFIGANGTNADSFMGETKFLHEAPAAAKRNTNNNKTSIIAQPQAQGQQIPDSPTLLHNATADDIAKATKLVDDAIAKNDAMMRDHMEHMARNHYTVKPSRSKTKSFAQAQDDQPPPFLELTEELRKAAALVAEVDAQKANVTRIPSHLRRRGGGWWMENIPRQGTMPFGGDASYKVFRNVMDYGAKADGVTDDSQAFRDAINDGRRCGKNCNGSTVKNAVVYVPAGTYVIGSTVPVLFGTQLIGDATSWPTLKAAPRVLGKGLLSTDEYTGGGLGPDGLDKEWYINTANFYRQIRNFKLDMTNTRDVDGVSAIHYQIAQATSLQFIEIGLRAQQTGIFSENGSGGVISDITINGGKYGFYGGDQQFTALRLKFDNVETAVRVIWDWGWVWKSISISNAKVGFQLIALKSNTTSTKRDLDRGKVGSIGSCSFLDSSWSNVGTAVLVKPISSDTGTGTTGIVVQNCKTTSDVNVFLADSDGKTIVQKLDEGQDTAVGPIYYADGHRDFGQPASVGPSWKYDGAPGASDNGLLAADNKYFERAKPQYENLHSEDFWSVKTLGAAGDGVTDDSTALEFAIVNATAAGKVAFVDAGAYIITRTITIPAGAVVVGEAWSQLMASGPYFSDKSNPQVMVRVGDPGSEGTVELQDLIFTTKGPTAGAVLVEWNIKASEQGKAALWDCHARIGGATGTELTPAECPPITDGIDPKCQAASLMMHITPHASGYFENMWLWVADHMIDDPQPDTPDNDMVQVSVYVARGFLIESQAPTWLYGTASEHSVMYQYNFHNAQQIFASMLQTESPYYQPNPLPPAPFDGTVGLFEGDVGYDACEAGGREYEFGGCDESWSLIVQKSKGLTIFGAGLYSWFSKYSQDCIDDQTCQKALTLFKDNYQDIKMYHMITIGAKYMAVIDGKGIAAKDNLNYNHHPFWSQISLLEVKGGDGSPDDPDNSDGDGDVWIDPSGFWDPDSPHTVQCKPPCTLHLPPYTGMSSDIPVPPATVVDGSSTVTLTRTPIHNTIWVIEPITVPRNHIDPTATTTTTTSSTTGPPIILITTGKFDTTTTWPPITSGSYTGTATETHPPPPPPPPPPKWPKITVYSGHPPKPTVPPCFFPDFSCPPTDNPDDPSDGGEDAPDPDEEDNHDDPEDPGFCFLFGDGPGSGDDGFPQGSQCKADGDCSCDQGTAGRCAKGWCGCLDILSPGGHVPGAGEGGDDGDGGDGTCGDSSECKAQFACDNGDSFCDSGGLCTCPPPLGPKCETASEDCSSLACDPVNSNIRAACVNGHCLCAGGIEVFVEYTFETVKTKTTFSLNYTGHPELSFEEKDKEVGGETYHIDYDGPDGSHVHWDWAKESKVTYRHKGESYDFFASDEIDRGVTGCDKGGTGFSYCRYRHGFYPVDWPGKDPNANYTIGTY